MGIALGGTAGQAEEGGERGWVGWREDMLSPGMMLAGAT